MKIDLARFDEVAGGLFGFFNALQEHETLYDGYGRSYKFVDGGLRFSSVILNNEWRDSSLSVNEAAERVWYIKKPFDVRQAMRDKPDEWVALFSDSEGEEWYKVGFDTDEFNAVYAPFNSNLSVNSDSAGIGFPTKEELDACIPLDEVPADAR